MRTVFGIWTMLVALTVSIAAAYYSIVGLTAIFAAAVIPVIIMGATLELAKVTSAIWLHSFWDEAPALTKIYLTSAVIILMFITSMGIFGFLSKAHIEQTSNSGSLVAKIDRLDQEIEREQQTIERANLTIDSFGSNVADTDTNIQTRIETQERLISDIRNRLEADIATQNQIISQSNTLLTPLQSELKRLDERREQLRAAQASGDIVALQALVGANTDGVLGPDTRSRIAEFERNLEERRSSILAQLERLNNSDNPAVIAAREEITRLQQTANAEISRAQEAINSFREQLVSVTTADNSAAIETQQQIINESNLQIDTLLNRKFDLQSDLRVLEVEVGPIRYVAELIYGETNQELLEQAVRWVIIIIVLVFDPLAIVLVLAGLSLLNREPIDNSPKIPYNGKNDDEDDTITLDDDPIEEDLPESNDTSKLEYVIPSVTGVTDNLSETQEEYEESASQSETQVAHEAPPEITKNKTPPKGEVTLDGRRTSTRPTNEK